MGNVEREKKYYGLWIEYLKQSGDYKDFCQWVVKKRKNPNLPVPEKFHKSKDGSAPKEVFIFFTFGNIHDSKFSFDKWWKRHKEKLNYTMLHKSPKAIEDFTEYIGGYIDTSIDSFKRHFKREPSLQELKEWLTNHIMKKVFGNSLYLMVNATDETVIEQFKGLVKKKKEDPRIKAFYFSSIKNRQPIINYEILSELQTYLKVYVFVSDLIKRQGDTKKSEAMKKAVEFFTKESIEEMKNTGRGNYKGDRYSSTMRKYNLYYAKAEQIIKNLEHGFFPLYKKNRKAKSY